MRLDAEYKKIIIKFAPYLVVPMVVSILIAGELLNVLTVVSLYLGFRFAPEKIWPSWLASVFLLWATYGLATLTGILDEDAGGETWWSFGFESFIFMFGLVAAPMWLGRLVKQRRAG